MVEKGSRPLVRGRPAIIDIFLKKDVILDRHLEQPMPFRFWEQAGATYAIFFCEMLKEDGPMTLK